MRKIRRKLKQHLRAKMQVYVVVLSVILLLAAAIIGAQYVAEGDVEHRNRVKSLVASSEEQYLEAIGKIQNGEYEEAKTMMLRLARLGNTEEHTLGYGKAHLWVAKDMLPTLKADFMGKFPLGHAAENRAALQKIDKDALALAQRHLEHVVVLNSEIEEGWTLLAASYFASNEISKGADVLIKAITHPKTPHPKLSIFLINFLFKADDDLALQERAWHWFSTLGQQIQSDDRQVVASRIRYVMSALILKKYESADIVIKRMEARFAHRLNDQNQGEKYSSHHIVKSTRAAYHYQRALAQLSSSKSASREVYAQVVNELNQVLRIQPDCKSAIDGLHYIGQQDSSFKKDIEKTLKGVLSSQVESSSATKSSVFLALALIGDKSPSEKRAYLNDALRVDAQNSDVIVHLIELMVREESPDYASIKSMAQNVLKSENSEYHARCHHVLGLVYFRMKDWHKAIVALEKALAGSSNSSEIHHMLSVAYSKVGKSNLSKMHAQASGG